MTHDPAASPPLRPSACPGLWRVVAARDGGICRIKLPGGVLSAEQADAVAEAAERQASGVVEATNRGNVQIRGVHGDPAALIEDLLQAGLGPREAAGDDVRNLMLSPLAGLDPLQACDVRPLGRAILRLLETTPRLHQLSAKFAIQLDGGERLAMLDHPHDLWLSAVWLEQRLWLVFGLAGAPANSAPVGAVPFESGLGLVAAVLQRFLDLADPQQHRMRQLLTDHTPEAFAEGLGIALRRDATVLSWRRVPSEASWLGRITQRRGTALGLAAPLGRLTPTQLRTLARLARSVGDGSLRITPWQSVLLPNVQAQHLQTAQTTLAAQGLLDDPRHALAQLVACTGAAGCARGLADTKADARRLATQVQGLAPASVHLSGCPRSCALAHVAPYTLLARAPGRYDLYTRDAQHAGFGRLRGRDLSLDDAGALLALPTEQLDD